MTVVASGYGGGDERLQFLMEGPSDLLASIQPEVAQRLKAMIQEWRNGKYDRFIRGRDDWSM